MKSFVFRFKFRSQQAINWNIAYPVYRRIYAALGADRLNVCVCVSGV